MFDKHRANQLCKRKEIPVEFLLFKTVERANCPKLF